MAYLAPLASVLGADARRLLRDRFLVGSFLYLVGTAVMMRWVLPWMTRALRGHRSFDLEPYYGLVISYFLVFLVPVLVGMIGGFLLLESREDRSIRALRVTPLPIRAYLVGLSIVMTLVTAILALLVASVIGLGQPPWSGMILITSSGALGAPLCALYLATFAANKVEAFAQMKLVGASGLVLLGVYFVDPPWQLVACLVPPFWSVKAWWIAEANQECWFLWVLGGVVLSLGCVLLLLGRFEDHLRRGRE